MRDGGRGRERERKDRVGQLEPGTMEERWRGIERESNSMSVKANPNYICIMIALVCAVLVSGSRGLCKPRAGCRVWCLEVLASSSIVEDVLPSSIGV